MLTGMLPPNAGTIVFDGHDITRLPMHRRIRLGLSRSFQILSVFPNLTAFENVRVAVQAQDRRQLRACGATPTPTTTSTPAPGRCWPRSGWRIAPPIPAPT